MILRFIHPAPVGPRVHAAGDVAEVPEPEASRLVASGAAEPIARQAVERREGVRTAVVRRSS